MFPIDITVNLLQLWYVASFIKQVENSAALDFLKDPFESSDSIFSRVYVLVPEHTDTHLSVEFNHIRQWASINTRSSATA